MLNEKVTMLKRDGFLGQKPYPFGTPATSSNTGDLNEYRIEATARAEEARASIILTNAVESHAIKRARGHRRPPSYIEHCNSNEAERGL